MASGESLALFSPFAAVMPSTSGAALTLKNRHPVIEFNGTSNESAIFSAIMPNAYSDATGVTVIIHWTSDGTTGDMDWDVDFERIAAASQDIDSDGFTGSPTSLDNVTVPATSGQVTYGSVAVSKGAGMDNIVAGDSFRMKITRDAANDTSTALSHILNIHLKET